MIAALESEGVRFDIPTDGWGPAEVIAAALIVVPLVVALVLAVTARAARTQENSAEENR